MQKFRNFVAVKSTQAPKILLLGDYSNCHNTLSTGLRHLGCDVTVASDGSRWMDCARQVDIRRRHAGKIGGALHYANMHRLLGGDLSGFDIVAIHDLNFADLRPERLRVLFDKLKKHNGKVFLTAMSTDIAYLDMLAATDSPLRYSEWFVDGATSRYSAANPAMWDSWHAKELVDYQNYALDNIDGAVSVLYEYHLAMQRRLGTHRAAYGGIPIDTSRYEQVDIPIHIEKVKIFLGRDRTRKLMKGSDLLETAAKTVVDRHPDKAVLEIVENRPFDEFTTLLRSAHIVLDQIYSYTPATTALMAMAYGLNVVSGAEPEYYKFINEADNHPIINAPIELEPLTATLEQLVMHPEQISSRGDASRQFVEKHNDTDIVARRFLDFWTK